MFTSLKKRDWSTFISSVFFVLGFSVVFSILGVLLQTILVRVSYLVQIWLSRVGGVIIIVFGLYVMGLISIDFLSREHKFSITRKFNSSYLASFVFGASFAVGWTPCVGAVLGAILTLAATQPSMALLLMLSYSFGLGVPFLLVGLFTNEARGLIKKAGRTLEYVNKFFGAILVLIGILVFTNQLSRLANFALATDILVSFNASISLGASLNLGIAFLAGIVSFLSPCVLPLIPGYLTYLASISTKNIAKKGKDSK